MSFKERFFETLGLRPKRLEPVVENDPGRDPDDLAEAAARTERVLRRPAPPIESGQALQGVTTDDVDPASGRLYVDYIERRHKREADRQARGESSGAALINWDISPK